jgi:putative acetyltransferase
VLVRRELSPDEAAVREVVAAAFASPNGAEPVEVRLLDALRACEQWLPRLSLVAEGPGGALVGHVVCSRAWVGELPVVALGPLAVGPEQQRQGVGTALMQAVLGAADALDEPLVALLGHRDYYPRFGFRRGDELGVQPPVPAWGAHFQVRPLSGWSPSLVGEFRYAQPFRDLG